MISPVATGEVVPEKGVEMPGKKHSGHTQDHAAKKPRTRAMRRLGPDHSSQDCHDLVLRLKAQAQCLEEVLADIREQIDELECEEILDHIEEEMLQADD